MASGSCGGTKSIDRLNKQLEGNNVSGKGDTGGNITYKSTDGDNTYVHKQLKDGTYEVYTHNENTGETKVKRVDSTGHDLYETSYKKYNPSAGGSNNRKGKSGNEKSGKGKSENGKSGNEKSEKGKSGNEKSGKGKSEKGKSENGKSGNEKSGKGKSGNEKSGKGKSENGKSENGKSGKGKSENGKSGNEKSGKGKSGNEKSGKGKSGKGKSENGKSGNEKSGKGKSGNEKSEKGKSEVSVKGKIIYTGEEGDMLYVHTQDEDGTYYVYSNNKSTGETEVKHVDSTGHDIYTRRYNNNKNNTISRRGKTAIEEGATSKTNLNNETTLIVTKTYADGSSAIYITNKKTGKTSVSYSKPNKKETPVVENRYPASGSSGGISPVKTGGGSGGTAPVKTGGGSGGYPSTGGSGGGNSSSTNYSYAGYGMAGLASYGASGSKSGGSKPKKTSSTSGTSTDSKVKKYETSLTQYKAVKKNITLAIKELEKAKKQEEKTQSIVKKYYVSNSNDLKKINTKLEKDILLAIDKQIKTLTTLSTSCDSKITKINEKISSLKEKESTTNEGASFSGTQPGAPQKA